MRPLTVDILVKCGADRAASGRFVGVLNELLPYYKVNTLLRLSHFLSQVIHESNRMTAVEEYASGAAYEGRLDLGNTEPGDGVRFKGRGLIQLTGRINYKSFANRFGVDCVNHPELIEQPRWAVASALDYWNTRKLNVLADKDDGYQITRRINGGYNGLEHRIKLLAQCRAAIAPLFE